jgi:peroxiredoxin
MKLGLLALSLIVGLRQNLPIDSHRVIGQDDPSAPVPAPEFVDVSEWLNSKPFKLADQKGRVVIVHFWTNGCINCIHNYSHYRAWTTKYKDNKELLMVGIHTPEFDAEKDVERIKAKAEKNRLTFAIAVDNKQANWKAWQNQYWPCVYLVDKTGNVRYRWAGELGDDGFKKVSGIIDELLAEKPAKRK